MFALTRFIVFTIALSSGVAHAAPTPSSSSLDHRAVDLDLNHVVIGTVTPIPIDAADIAEGATTPSDNVLEESVVSSDGVARRAGEHQLVFHTRVCSLIIFPVSKVPRSHLHYPLRMSPTPGMPLLRRPISVGKGIEIVRYG